MVFRFRHAAVEGKPSIDEERIRRQVEHTQAVTKDIEDRMVAASEDLYDTPGARMDLHVTIRIACDFHQFLLNHGETPSDLDADYVMGTIRSGMDQYFSLAQSASIIGDGLARWNFDQQVIASFPELRNACLLRFQELFNPQANPCELLASLIALVHLELLFLAHTFPLIVSRFKENK
jgi:hypothetical protein